MKPPRLFKPEAQVTPAPYWVPKGKEKTVGGQAVGLTPLRCETDGGGDYCMHCGKDMLKRPSVPCSVLEFRRLEMIPDELVQAWGCAWEAKQSGAERCAKWCKRPGCSVVLVKPQIDGEPTLAVSEFDSLTDSIVIEGVRYAGEVFRTLGLAPPGDVFRVVARDGEVLTLQRLYTGGIVTGGADSGGGHAKK